MKNVPKQLMVSIGMVVLMMGCPPNQEERIYMITEVVELESKNGWLLQVNIDGSGQLEHRACDYKATLPAGSIDFQKIRLLPAFVPQNRVVYPFRWTYTRLSTNDVQQYGLSDTLWAAKRFKEAFHKCINKNENPSLNRKLIKYWRDSPPAGVR